MIYLGQDLRFVVRGMVRRPLFRVVAVLILALGLGAVVSVFTYLNGFNQAFPGADPRGLVQVFGADEEDPFQAVSYLDYLDFAEAARSFDGMAAVQSYYAASVRLEELTVVAFLDAVGGDYFQVLGVEPAIGRLLTADDDRPEAEPAAVISFEWWQTQFNADPGVLGTTLYLNYRPHTIIGVASSAFVGSASDARPHVWIPIAPFRDRYVSWDRMAQNRDLPLVRVFARLRDGVSVDQARQDLVSVAGNLDQLYPRAESSRGIHVQRATWIDPRVRLNEVSTNRIILFAAVGFLLLVCANVANLLLSVYSSRRKELALQAAMGASRLRLIRGVLLENVFLAVVAGALAVAVAGPASARLGSYFARPSVWGENVSRQISLDARVVLFAIGVSLLTGLLAGAFPAIRAFGKDLLTDLKTTTSGAGTGVRFLGWRGLGLREALTSVQVALSVVLLVVSGLVLKTLGNVGAVDPGFRYEQLIGSHISTSSTSIEVEERERFFRGVEEDIEREPWVVSATVSGNAPLSGHGSLNVRTGGSEEAEPVLVARVHDGFFEKLGVEVVAGRTFAESDSAGAPPVAILNRPAADRFFSAQTAVGRQIFVATEGAPDQALDIVGVVGDTKVRDFLGPAEPAVYLHFSQQAYGSGTGFLVTVRGDPEAAVPRLHQWLRAYEPHLAIVNAISYRSVVRGATYVQRMNAELFSLMAMLGLVLATVGIFSVVSLSVTRRTREIGVRKAIGATSPVVNRSVVFQAMGPVLLGVFLGLAMALSASRLFQALLFGVEPSDPMGLLGGSVTLLLAAALAAYLPARRAGSVDPVKALKVE